MYHVQFFEEGFHMLIVQKFGGSSVADPEHIKNVARIVKKTKQAGNKVVVVVSAPGDTTDDLITLSSGVTKFSYPREMDMLLSTGEQISISLLSMALQDMGMKAVSLTGWQAGISTEEVFGKAKILKIDPKAILAQLKNNKIVIVAGFQGITKNGEITTLGRGGSDTTAVALASALKADVCDIYTDVNGIYTTDPRIVPQARRIKKISYDEVLEMASLGAKVLHPRAAEIGKVHGLKVRVRSTFQPSDEGTVLVCTDKKHIAKIANHSGGAMEKTYVVSATSDKNQAKITIVRIPDKPGIVSKVFLPIAKEHINVDVIVQNASHEGYTDLSFTVSSDDLTKTLKIVGKVAKEIKAKEVLSSHDVAKVSIVGAGMYSYPGVAAKMFASLAKAGINIEMISTSEIKISCVIKQKDADNAVRILHKEFSLDKK